MPVGVSIKKWIPTSQQVLWESLSKTRQNSRPGYQLPPIKICYNRNCHRDVWRVSNNYAKEKIISMQVFDFSRSKFRFRIPSSGTLDFFGTHPLNFLDMRLPEGRFGISVKWDSLLIEIRNASKKAANSRRRDVFSDKKLNWDKRLHLNILDPSQFAEN